MTVKQLSVFLENKPGKLAEFTDVLHQHGIDIRALSLAEASDFGILRLIVSDSYSAVQVIKEEGYVCSITPVLAVAISDKPGSLSSVIKLLGENGINLEYTYAFITRKKDTAYMIFRVEDNKKAIEILTKNNIHCICQDELNDLHS